MSAGAAVKKVAVILGSLCLCLLVAGCRHLSGSAQWQEVQRSQPLLGTYVVITAYGPDQTQVQQAVSAAFAEIRRVDQLMSLHREDSELAGINRHAAQRPVKVSPELYQVISLGQEIARQTDGAFDLTVAPLVQLWGFIWKDYRLPTAPELAAVMPRVGYQNVALDPASRTVSFLRPQMALDLGGIAKGYAVDCALAKLIELGVSNAMVRAGGDLGVSGTRPGNRLWTVQLEDPTRQGQRRTIELVAGALSTSGNYENYFVVDGRRYSHMLDPRTGQPVAAVASSTVLAPTCVESDAWATAAAVLGPETAMEQVPHPLRLLLPDAAGGFRELTSETFPPQP